MQTLGLPLWRKVSLRHTSHMQRAARFLTEATTVAPMTEAEALEALQYMHPIVVPAGELFIMEDDIVHTDFLMLIVEGEVVAEDSLCDNRSLTMNVVPAGRWVGELSMLDGMERVANCRASEGMDVLCAMLTKREFLRLLDEHPALGAKLALVLAFSVTRYLREVHHKLMRLTEIQAAQQRALI